MLFRSPRVGGGLILAFIISLGPWFITEAQNPSQLAGASHGNHSAPTVGRDETLASVPVKPSGVSPTLERYFDPLQGASSNDLVRRVLASNGEQVAARIEIERARARLRQAGLRPNPTLDFEQATGSYTNSSGEGETSIGVALPIELGGKRRRRIELAQAEVEAVEADVADRERRLVGEVRSIYVEALALAEIGRAHV